MAFKGTLIRSGDNAKTIKGDGEYETAIMYLAPFKQAAIGYGNVCPMAEVAGCVAGCLNSAGRGAYSNVQLARINKTKRYWASRRQFMIDLTRDIGRFVQYCERKGVKPAVRLNGTSDIQWEVAHPVPLEAWSPFVPLGHGWNSDDAPSIFAVFPQVQFYDYTKVYKRVYKTLPVNYRLVLSYSEANPQYADAIIGAARDTGANMAVVYRTKELRDELLGMSEHFSGPTRMTNRVVIDGDSDDMRFLDPTGVIVGLYAKGAAKRDTSGFVVG